MQVSMPMQRKVTTPSIISHCLRVMGDDLGSQVLERPKGRQLVLAVGSVNAGVCGSFSEFTL